jgi:hypothetical protein
MKNNSRIILFICITIFVLILGIYYLNYCDNYTSYSRSILEPFNTTGKNPYSIRIEYPVTTSSTSTKSIYSDEVINSGLPAIYDVSRSNVNLCYGDGTRSLYTYPYIILVLRAYYLYNNNQTNTQEYKDILTVLQSSDKYVKSTLTAEASAIITNSTNISILQKLTGHTLIKACMRVYPNWLTNPTNGIYGNINSATDIFINDSAISATNNNPNTFAFLYTKPNAIIPQNSILQSKLTYDKNIIPQYTELSSDPSADPSLEMKTVNVLPKENTLNGQMFQMELNDFKNINNAYCSSASSGIEWTHEFANANNLNMNDSDVYLKLLLNPLTGDILKCTFVKFVSNTLNFVNVDSKNRTIPRNIIELFPLPPNYQNAPDNIDYGIRIKKFNNIKINKYIFDNCGRIYKQLPQLEGFNSIDLTQIYYSSTGLNDLKKEINDISNILTGHTKNGYHIISTLNNTYIDNITTNIIDNIYNLPQIYIDSIDAIFTMDLFNKRPTNTGQNTFTALFNSDKSFKNIIEHTSSDGFVYVNLGQIHENIENQIETLINQNVTPRIINGFKAILMAQIETNTPQIMNLVKRLTEYQVQLYNNMNDIVSYLESIIKIISISPDSPDAVPIPILDNTKIAALSAISNSSGYITPGDIQAMQAYKTAQDAIDLETQKDIKDISVLTLDIPQMNAIRVYFKSLLQSVAPQGGGAISLFRENNYNNIKSNIGKMNVLIGSNFNRANPDTFGTNLNTANYFLSLIVGSVRSLLIYTNNLRKELYPKRLADEAAYISAQKLVNEDNAKLDSDNKRYDADIAIFNRINAFNRMINRRWDWWRNFLRVFRLNYNNRYRYSTGAATSTAGTSMYIPGGSFENETYTKSDTPPPVVFSLPQPFPSNDFLSEMKAPPGIIIPPSKLLGNMASSSRPTEITSGILKEFSTNNNTKNIDTVRTLLDNINIIY